LILAWWVELRVLAAATSGSVVWHDTRKHKELSHSREVMLLTSELGFGRDLWCTIEAWRREVGAAASSI
jgi:hypothetical protein